MKLKIWAICLLLLIPGYCFAAGINSPLTLYAETQRGRDETFAALSNAYLTQTLAAISSVIDENRQKNTDTDAFYLGTDYTACLSLTAFLDKDTMPEAVYTLAKKNFTYYYNDLQAKEKKLGIDDKTLASLLNIHERDYFVETLKKWNALANDPN